MLGRDPEASGGIRADAVVSKGLAIDDGSCGVFWMGAGCM